jgi:hypothetical protein
MLSVLVIAFAPITGPMVTCENLKFNLEMEDPVGLDHGANQN